MKKLLRWAIMGCFMFAAAHVNAQNNTNLDSLVLNLTVNLRSYTNGIPLTNGNIVTAKAVPDTINTKDIIQLLSGRRSFPLAKGFSGQGDAIFIRNAAVVSNYTSAAKLLIVQGLVTNSGQFFVIVRDGRPAIDYDVSEYFTFNTKGFEPLDDDQVTTGRLNLDTTETASTRLYVEEFGFDNQAGSDKVAFLVDGFTTDISGSLKEKGVIIQDEVTRSLNASVAGTGSISNNFAVLRGTINASGARHERK